MVNIVGSAASDGSAHLVEVLVVCPDALVGGLSAAAPGPVLGVVPHDVNDAARGVERLVNANKERVMRI